MLNGLSVGIVGTKGKGFAYVCEQFAGAKTRLCTCWAIAWAIASSFYVFNAYNGYHNFLLLK